MFGKIKRFFGGNHVRSTLRPSRGRSVLLRIELLEERCLLTTVINAGDVGNGSLRKAIVDDTADNGTVNFGGNFDINLFSPITIAKNLTITGGGNTISLSGRGLNSIFIVAAGKTVTIDNITFANGVSATVGGAINSSGTLIINGDTFRGNVAASGGGAIETTGAGSSLVVTSCSFSNNSIAGAVGNGGAIEAKTSSLTITSSTFRNNKATVNGGAISMDDAADLSLSILGSNFDDNQAGAGAIIGGGGAVCATNFLVTIGNCSFDGNTAISAGGAVDYVPSTVWIPAVNSSRSFTVSEDDFENNWSMGVGGAVFAFINPGGVAVGCFSGQIVGCFFGNNFANHDPNPEVPPVFAGAGGGGLFLSQRSVTDGPATTLISNSTFFSNFADVGGGLFLLNAKTGASPSSITLTSLTVTKNVGRNGGGGISVIV